MLEKKIKSISETNFFTILDDLIKQNQDLKLEEKFESRKIENKKKEKEENNLVTKKIPLSHYENKIYTLSVEKSELSIFNMNLERSFTLTLKLFKEKKLILKNIETKKEQLKEKLDLYYKKKKTKENELEMNEIFYNYLIKRYMEDLAILFLQRDHIYKTFQKIDLEKIFSEDKKNQKIINFFITRVMMFVVFSAKFIELFLVPNYHFLGDKSYLTVFFHKLNNYPLFFDKNYGLNSPKMALKYLHSDFVKILKHLEVEIEVSCCLFDNFSDLTNLIDIFYEKYLIK